MAINYNNGSAVKHLKYNGNYVKELKYNGTVAWEDVCAVWSPGTMPDGVASISAQRYGKKEPSAKTYTALASGESVYNGDTLYISLTPASYWTLSSSSFTTTVTSGAYSSLGTEYTITAEKAMAMGNITASQEMRTVTLTVNTGVANIYILETGGYYNRSTSLSLWYGTGVHWSATAADGYTLDSGSSSGTLTIGSGAQTVAPTASAAAATWHEATDWSECFSSISWSSTEWSTSGSYHYSTVKKLITTSESDKGGLLSYGAGNVRVNGTATFTSATGTKYTRTFSYTTLTSSTGYRSVAVCSFDYSGTTVYVRLELKLTDRIDCRFRVNPASSFPLSSIVAATFQLTSIDVKTRFSTGVVDIYNEDSYGFYVDSYIPDQSVYVYILGNFDWSDGYGLDSQSFVATGTVQPNGSIYIDNTYFSGSDQATFNGGSVAVALCSTDGTKTMLTPPCTYEL